VLFGNDHQNLGKQPQFMVNAASPPFDRSRTSAVSQTDAKPAGRAL